MSDRPETRSEASIRHAQTAGDLAQVRDRQSELTRDFADLRKSVDDTAQLVTTLSGRIPDDLEKRLITIELMLQHLSKGIQTEFVSRTEFEIMKVEHVQMRRLVYGFVGLALVSIIGALLGLVVNNTGNFIK